jgi:hypothetical protein
VLHQRPDGAGVIQTHEWNMSRFLACCVGASALITVSHMLQNNYPAGCPALDAAVVGLVAV